MFSPTDLVVMAVGHFSVLLLSGARGSFPCAGHFSLGPSIVSLPTYVSRSFSSLLLCVLS